MTPTPPQSPTYDYDAASAFRPIGSQQYESDTFDNPIARPIPQMVTFQPLAREHQQPFPYAENRSNREHSMSQHQIEFDRQVALRLQEIENARDHGTNPTVTSAPTAATASAQAPSSGSVIPIQVEQSPTIHTHGQPRESTNVGSQGRLLSNWQADPHRTPLTHRKERQQPIKQLSQRPAQLHWDPELTQHAHRQNYGEGVYSEIPSPQQQNPTAQYYRQDNPPMQDHATRTSHEDHLRHVSQFFRDNPPHRHQ